MFINKARKGIKMLNDSTQEFANYISAVCQSYVNDTVTATERDNSNNYKLLSSVS